MKQFNIKYNVGKLKYIINYHDGVKKHEDGSPFFDIGIFKSKKMMDNFAKQLTNEGYIHLLNS